jgi:hypothetical protein
MHFNESLREGELRETVGRDHRPAACMLELPVSSFANPTDSDVELARPTRLRRRFPANRSQWIFQSQSFLGDRSRVEGVATTKVSQTLAKARSRNWNLFELHLWILYRYTIYLLLNVQKIASCCQITEDPRHEPAPKRPQNR